MKKARIFKHADGRWWVLYPWGYVQAFEQFWNAISYADAVMRRQVSEVVSSGI